MSKTVEVLYVGTWTPNSVDCREPAHCGVSYIYKTSINMTDQLDSQFVCSIQIYTKQLHIWLTNLVG